MKLPKDYKLEITRGHGPGGQHKNKVETCAIVTHIPTGISQTCQDSRSKISNIELAYSRVLEKVNEYYRNLEEEKINELRTSQINSGDRSFRRRTYNYKTNIVTDHVTGKKASLKEILNGNLDLLR